MQDMYDIEHVANIGYYVLFYLFLHLWLREAGNKYAGHNAISLFSIHVMTREDITGLLRKVSSFCYQKNKPNCQ